jgi:hypothetical protein
MIRLPDDQIDNRRRESVYRGFLTAPASPGTPRDKGSQPLQAHWTEAMVSQLEYVMAARWATAVLMALPVRRMAARSGSP